MINNLQMFLLVFSLHWPNSFQNTLTNTLGLIFVYNKLQAQLPQTLQPPNQQQRDAATRYEESFVRVLRRLHHRRRRHRRMPLLWRVQSERIASNTRGSWRDAAAERTTGRMCVSSTQMHFCIGSRLEWRRRRHTFCTDACQ